MTGVPEQYAIFPIINATLNGLSAVLLLIGYRFIRSRRISAHRAVMIAAFTSSVLFLCSYLYYHISLYLQGGSGSVRFQGQGLVRTVYFTILLSHTILAIVIVPLVLITSSRGLSKKYDKHRAIARWTFPLWLYVSVTGVVIYFMLYQWFAKG